MSQHSMIDILIFADRASTASRWARVLQTPGRRVWLTAEDVPGPGPPHVILTNRPVAFQQPGVAELESKAKPESAADRKPPVEHVRPAGGDGTRTGVIRVGSAGISDVQLPDHATDRELRLACELLAEIVRLRRRDHARAETHRRLREEALTDPVTELPNRRAWDHALQSRAEASSDRTGLLCLAVLDLDHFKRVNEAHGHAAGDRVLRGVGKVISGGLRDGDFVARLGGDEFGLLLTVADAGSAQAVVDRVRRRLASGLAASGMSPITGSAGFCVHGTEAEEGPATPIPPPAPSPLFLAADAALRVAKRQGRDRTVEGRPAGK